MDNLVSQLKSLKHRQEAGWADSSVREDLRSRLMSAIEHQEIEATFSVRENVAYYRWIFNDLVSKPVVVGVAAFVFLIGGWITSVNAASNSLPGDTFYSLKLATEQARISLASSEHRAILHTEYAQRRYKEALAISHSPERQIFLDQTLIAFEEQIDLANTQLQILRDEQSEEMLAVATAVDQKIGELNAVIDEAATQTTDIDEVAKISDARETAQTTQTAVVDVIVGTHDDTQSVTTDEDLDALFRKELTELRSREAFDLSRLSVIESAMASNAEAFEGVELPIGESLNVVEYNITKATAPAGEAMNLVAAGGYRAAFDILETANQQLLDIERQLALVEMTVMQTLSAASKTPADAVPTDSQPSESTSNNIDSSGGA